MSTADYQRQWRARQGAQTGRVGRPPSQPCGTTAAYKRHHRNNEEACQACKDAWAAYVRNLYRRKKVKP